MTHAESKVAMTMEDLHVVLAADACGESLQVKDPSMAKFSIYTSTYSAHMHERTPVTRYPWIADATVLFYSLRDPIIPNSIWYYIKKNKK